MFKNIVHPIFTFFGVFGHIYVFEILLQWD